MFHYERLCVGAFLWGFVPSWTLTIFFIINCKLVFEDTSSYWKDYQNRNLRHKTTACWRQCFITLSLCSRIFLLSIGVLVIHIRFSVVEGFSRARGHLGTSSNPLFSGIEFRTKFTKQLLYVKRYRFKNQNELKKTTFIFKRV